MLCSFPGIPYLLFEHITYLFIILILCQQLPRLVVTMLHDQQVLYQELFRMARLFQKNKSNALEIVVSVYTGLQSFSGKWREFFLSFIQTPSFPMPSLFPCKFNTLANKVTEFWKYFSINKCFLSLQPWRGKIVLGGKDKFPEMYLGLCFELLTLQGTWSWCISHIRFLVNRNTNRTSKAGFRTLHKSHISSSFGIFFFFFWTTLKPLLPFAFRFPTVAPRQFKWQQ